MKKKVGLIVLAIMTISLILVALFIKLGNGSKTIQEAITPPGSKPISIIQNKNYSKVSINNYY